MEYGSAYAAPYVGREEYAAMSRARAVPEEGLEKALEDAQRDIDALAFGRIRAIGLGALTPFQRGLVKRAVVLQADFRAQYGDLLDNPLASYAINGVSMSWDSAKIRSVAGVYTHGDVYSLLRQTGLACREAGR